MVGETPMVSSDLALVPIKATGVMVEAAHRVEEKEEELLSFERTWEIMIAASPVQLVAVSGAWSPAEWTQAIAKQLGAAHAGCWRCGALSEVLARILSLSGYDAKVVNGLANGTAHAWVEVEGVVYDATAEQFAAPIAYERGPDFLQSARRTNEDEYMSVTLDRDGNVTSHNAFDANFDEMVRATRKIISALQERLGRRDRCPFRSGKALREDTSPSEDLDEATVERVGLALKKHWLANSGAPASAYFESMARAAIFAIATEQHQHGSGNGDVA